MSNFSERLAELMFENNDIKSEQLGNELGISGATIRRWQSGNQEILLSNLIKLADYFNCSIDFLAARTENKLDFLPLPCPPFYNAFRSALEANKITRYRFTKETRFKDPFFTKWKKSADPHIQTLIEISNYLDISIDCLVGRDK